MSAESLNAAINLRLAMLGLPMADDPEGVSAAQLVSPILARQRELSRRLSDRLSPADLRIQRFVEDYLGDAETAPQLPRRTLVLDQPGLARGLSLPMKGDTFTSELVTSHRLLNGVLHNPANDRRTTAGVFHIAEGGLPIPDDKIAVPAHAFAELFRRAFEPPAESLVLPFTANEPHPAGCFVSLLLRPVVVPEVPGFTTEKRMEIRFFVPGGLVSNLDFVEAIFGNGGDPYLPENDSSLAPEGWTGHTGCVVLAPHLIRVTKKELGLPHWDDATERQRRDGMCYRADDERYNDGKAFKICARDERGVIVTAIADNYFGYCKKEVKTQISYSANLYGSVEEEHAGGAIVYPAYNEGPGFTDVSAGPDHRLADVLVRDPERLEPQPEGHALDRANPHIVLVPERSTFSLADRSVSWTTADGEERAIPLRADRTYVGPNGFRTQMRQSLADPTVWVLIGTDPDATHCHKPSTVSGGGKSEISKAISDAFIPGSVFVADVDADMDAIADILARDYSDRFADDALTGTDTRSILSPARSVGSVIKLMTPSSDFTEEHNEWIRSLPPHLLEILFAVKRSYQPEWGEDWRSHFSVGLINGRPGNSLRLDGEKVQINTLRVGFDDDGGWRIFGLRHDFSPAAKVQTEDDITASVVVPASVTGRSDGLSRKVVKNCEQLLFQRPDDAIHRGYDTQAEADIAAEGTFLSNFEPLTAEDARAMVEDAVAFSRFTAPMQDLVRRAAELAPGESPSFFVSSANPRLVNGKPSKNPRYLQVRPDLARPQETEAAAVASHLFHRRPLDEPLPMPVDVVAAGRRNNPPEDGVPPLCTYNPLHYMELPELFMEFVSSMTGKSPSTTGAGSEGALTKGPFNALPAIIDLNQSFVQFAVTGYDGWLSCAGYVGPRVRVDHDISLLVPEVFARMSAAERDAASLVAEGYLERLEDVEHAGRPVLASRLGYRMTEKFAITYFGRIFLHPDVVFTPEMLRPELQDPDVFAESMATIVTTHEAVARRYLADGTIDQAVPPLRALLEIMADGVTSDGLTLDAPELRAMFTRESVLASDWYAERLDAKQAGDVRRARDAVAALTDFVEQPRNTEPIERLRIRDRLAAASAEVDRVSSAAYREGLVGTIGLQPL